MKVKRSAVTGSQTQCSATEPQQLDNDQPSQSCTGGTECFSRTPGNHSEYAIRTLLGVDRKILSISKEPMLSGFSRSKRHILSGCQVQLGHSVPPICSTYKCSLPRQSVGSKYYRKDHESAELK